MISDLASLFGHNHFLGKCLLFWKQARQLRTMCFCVFSWWLYSWRLPWPPFQCLWQQGDKLPNFKVVSLTELFVLGLLICPIFNCLGHIGYKVNHLWGSVACPLRDLGKGRRGGKYQVSDSQQSKKAKGGNTSFTSRVTHRGHRNSRLPH